MIASLTGPLMVFDTYAVRDGSEAAGYDAWLKAVDWPFFHGRPGVVAYYCWKVIERFGPLHPFGRGRAEPYTYFSFFSVEAFDAFADMLVSPEAQAHVPQWVRSWAVEPDAADMARNFSFTQCRRVAGPDGGGAYVTLLPFAAAAGLPAAAADGDQHWTVTGRLQGDYQPDSFLLRFTDQPDDFAALRQHAPAAVLGRLIAGPGL